jgi:hypothetical protein
VVFLCHSLILYDYSELQSLSQKNSSRTGSWAKNPLQGLNSDELEEITEMPSQNSSNGNRKQRQHRKVRILEF